MAFPVGWNRVTSLTIQHAQVAADQTNFKTLLTKDCLPAEMLTLGGPNAAQADGGDIRFSSDIAGAVQLACDVVIWQQNANPALALAEIWVPTNPLSATNVTFYVWYNAGGGQTQPAANAPFGSQAVYDANYLVVCHLPDGVTLNTNDSTSNANNLTNSGGTASAGEIDGAITFAGGTNNAQAPNTGNRFDLANWTMDAWVKPTWASGSLGYNPCVFCLRNGGAANTRMSWHIHSDYSGSDAFNGSGAAQATGGAWAQNSIVHVVFTYAAGTITVYRNGVSLGSFAYAQGAAAGQPLTIGNDGNLEGFIGFEDEFTFSNVARSASLIATEFNNVNSPGAFIQAGASGAPQARITQDAVEVAASQSGLVRIGQDVIEFVTGAGVSCGSPPLGYINIPYVHTFPSGGGTPPYTFSISAGALPPGLVLNAATGEVTGTPNTLGVFTFTVTILDSMGTTSGVTCSITITVPASTPNSIVGGLPFESPGCKRRNEFDWCMFMEAIRYRRITFPPLCSIPEEFRNCMPWDENFGALPIQAVPFYKEHGIVTPAPIDGDVVVTQWRVPTGWDGLLTAIYFIYTGTGFEQGSGDILTRLRINLRYVKDLGNNPFLIGTPTAPMPMTQGQILLSNTLVTSLVNVPNLSGNIQVGTSFITAAQIGFLWPRG